MGFSGGSDSKVFTYNVGDWVYPWVGKIPWRRAWKLTPVFLPGESPWTEEPEVPQSMGSQRVEDDCMTKHTHSLDFTQSIIDKETEQACKTTGRILIFSRAR